MTHKWYYISLVKYKDLLSDDMYASQLEPEHVTLRANDYNRIFTPSPDTLVWKVRDDSKSSLSDR